jgi:hypothetical protein
MSVIKLKDGRYVVKDRKGRNPDDPNLMKNLPALLCSSFMFYCVC